MTNPSLNPRQNSFARHARFAFLILLTCVIAFAAPNLLAADRLIAGQYEITSTVDGHSTTSSYCATAEMAKGTNGDAKGDRAYVEAAVKSCSIQSFDLSGDTISYTITCSGHSTTISATYHGDHFEGDMTASVRGQTRKTHTTAKRTGACTDAK